VSLTVVASGRGITPSVAFSGALPKRKNRAFIASSNGVTTPTLASIHTVHAEYFGLPTSLY